MRGPREEWRLVVATFRSLLDDCISPHVTGREYALARKTIDELDERIHELESCEEP